MLKTLKLPVGFFGSNCCLAWDNENRQAVIIDPGSEPDRIMAEVLERGLDVRYILNTHGHGDHIGANREIKEAYGAPLLIHQADALMLTDPELNISAAFGIPITSPAADRYLLPGEKVSFGSLGLEVLWTPGHTPGGVSFYGAGVVFTGDTLFCGSIGRYDLPGGNESLLVGSIKEKLLTLPHETVVLPGHGQNTTIGVEKNCNPFLI